MNIADPNLLVIIAKHISDKSTLNSFARSSKKCSQIARKLTKIKKFEFKHINFIHSKSTYIWDGCYTKGMITDTCARVWFYPCGLEIVYDNGIEMKDYNDKFDIYSIEEDYLLGDFCHLREQSLNFIIDNLKNDTGNVCRFTSPPNEELADLKYTYKEIKRELAIEIFIDSIKNENLMVYNDERYILIIWIVRNLKAAIEELKEVSELCHKN